MDRQLFAALLAFGRFARFGRLQIVGEHLLVFFAFLALSVVLTYPLALNFFDSVAGRFDVYWDLWLLWWFKKAVLELGANPFVADGIFRQAAGANLYLSTAMPLVAFAAIPLQGFLDLYGTYNLFFLLSFVLSGYTMYLLARHLGGGWQASLLAGVVFAFAPYRFGHLIHLNLLQTQWIPLYALFFLKMWQGRRREGAVLCGVALALNFFSEVQYAVMLVIFSLFFVVHESWGKKEWRESLLGRWKEGAVAVFVFSAITAPLLLPMLKELLFVGYVPVSTGFPVAFGLDALSFITPAPAHPLFGGFVAQLYSAGGIFGSYNFGNAAESVGFVGFGVFALAVYAVARVRGAAVGLWSSASVFFAALAMGFFPKVGGFLVPLLLPFFFLYLVPGISGIRVPSRFAVITMMGFAVLASMVVEGLRKRMGPAKFRLAYAGLLALVVFEFLAVPLSMSNPNEGVDPFFSQLGKEKGDFAIAYYGVSSIKQREIDFYSQFLQVIHGKDTVSGQLSRVPASALAFQEKKEVMWIVEGVEPKGLDYEGVRRTLALAGVRYVVAFRELAGEGELLGLEAVFGKPVYESGKVVAFAVRGAGVE